MKCNAVPLIIDQEEIRPQEMKLRCVASNLSDSTSFQYDSWILLPVKLSLLGKHGKQFLLSCCTIFFLKY